MMNDTPTRTELQAAASRVLNEVTIHAEADQFSADLTLLAQHAASGRAEFEAAALPPLPEPFDVVIYNASKGYSYDAFSADQMREYARTAIAAAMGWPTVPEQADEVKRLRAVVDAAQEWSADRAVRDWSDADLLKALWTFNGDTIEPCPECDGDCGEPCAPCTVTQAHAAIDATLDDLVKRGKLYRGEPLPPAPTVPEVKL